MAPCERWVKDSKERKKKKETWPDPAVDRQSSGHRARSVALSGARQGAGRTNHWPTTVQTFRWPCCVARDSTGISGAA